MLKLRCLFVQRVISIIGFDGLKAKAVWKRSMSSGRMS
jgi:hypothetical protein